MKRKAIIPLVLGLAIGLFTVKFLVDAIRTAKASGRSTETITVVRAKEDIGAFEAIRPEAVELVETSDSLLAPPNERIESLEEVVGRVTAKNIPERAPILLTMLADKGTKPGLPGRIPSGFRAVSVKIDEVTGVAYQLQPGDWVDVYVVMDVDNPNRRGPKETVAERILQHVKVAAIGHETANAPAATAAKVKPAKSVTLLVPEDDVPKLHLAATRGKVTLAMRGDDEAITDSPNIADMGDVLTGRPGVVPDSVKQPKSFLTQAMDSLMGAAGSAAKPTPSVTERTLLGSDSRLEPQPEPYTVLVYQHSTNERVPATVEQVTFADTESATIVEVSSGPPSRASAMMRGTARPSSGRVRSESFSPKSRRSDNTEEKSLPNNGQ